ncbi:MAG: CdaR family protein [Candidatus Zixiibacteriota bacterium]
MRSLFSPGNILNNVGLKFLGLLLAVILWFHVATNREYDSTVDYQFEFIGLPDSLALGEAPPSGVIVHAQGSGKQLLRLMWQDRRWVIGLQDAKQGMLKVPLSPDQAPNYGMEELQFIALEGPTELNLLIDSIMERRLPILPDYSIEPSPEHALAQAPAWEPDSVTVRGPAGVIARLDRIQTARVDLRGVSSPVDQEVQLIPPAGHGVSIMPDRVHLRLGVDKLAQRVFADLPIEVVLPRGSDSSVVSPASVTLEIGGPETALTALAPDSISVRCVIDREDTTGVRRSLWVHVPEPLRVLKMTPDSVTVERHARTRTHSRN